MTRMRRETAVAAAGVASGLMALSFYWTFFTGPQPEKVGPVAPPRTGPLAGEPLPEFDLPTTDGDRVSKRELVSKGPFLLNLTSYT